MFKKKALKGAFHGPAGGSFSQKKKVVFDNVKHSGDKKYISLSKSGPGNNIYSDIKSLSGDNEDVSMSGVNGGSLLGLAAITFKTNSPNFHMDDNEVVFFSRLFIPLNKKWIDPKIIKTSMEVSVKKSFALDINFSAIEKKSTTTKTQLIRKIFSLVNGFGGATTSSKFEIIIKSTFTLEKSMEIVTLLAREKGININNNLKRQGIRSDQAVVIKKIPMDTSKNMIIAVISEFGEIKLVKFAELDQANFLVSKWSFLIGKDSVCVAKAVGDHEIWASRDWFRVLLFTLPIRTITHNLGTLLERAGGKTCIINKSVKTGNKIHCAVVGFDSNNNLKFVFCMELIFGSVKLSWTRMDLFGHSALECDALFASISMSLKTFKRVQVVLLAGFSDSLCFASGSGFPFFGVSALFAQAQTPNSPLNQFARPEDFTSLRSPTRQQEPLQTSSNLLDFLAENQSEHSETAANEENNSEITEEELIDSKNEEDEMTTYITKIPEFNGKDIETSPQEWLNQVTKAGDANGWNAARMLRTIPYFLKGTAGEWFENLAAPFND
ncbi:hypothetical protein G9A89_023747 [Geosiphon pyriformis]|nr:hypothetical protein G9A89_023747 [Geosiphon pyriformis]